MLYLDYAIYNEDMFSENQRKLPSFLKRILYNLKKIMGQVYKYKIDNRTVVVIPKINKKVKQKIDKILKIDVTKNVCVCNELMRNENFMNYLNEKNVNIINGKWLFKNMMSNVLDYICDNLNISSKTQEITILTNENNSLIFESIKKLSDKVKSINIVTREKNLFKTLEEHIYNEKETKLIISDIDKKRVIKSNIIFNLNFVQEDIDRIIVPKTTVIINFETDVKIKQKNFKGLNINSFGINLPLKYKNIYSRLNNFSSVNLYESFIYKKTVVENIWEEIEKNGVEVVFLENKDGIIKFDYYNKIVVNS